MSFLGLYRDPVVAKVTRHCDWRIRDLVEGDRPTTLYLVVPPSDISRTKPTGTADPQSDRPALDGRLQAKESAAASCC